MSAAKPALSIVMPAHDEASDIEAALTALRPYRHRDIEVIVADGGSTDGTPDLARPLADQVVTAPRGRSLQMNAGAAAARGDVLLFLHADTRLPDNANRLVLDGLARSNRVWGRFDVTIDGGRLLAVISMMMSTRSRLTGIATGDQAMFMTRAAFDAAGGFPTIALMEDVALSERLKHLSKPLCLRARVTTSPRRWRKHGVVRTAADVVAAAAVLLRRQSGQAGAGLWLCGVIRRRQPGRRRSRTLRCSYCRRIRTKPQTISKAAATRMARSGSLRTTTAIAAPNSTLVSRSVATIAMGASVIAHSTMP